MSMQPPLHACTYGYARASRELRNGPEVGQVNRAESWYLWNFDGQMMGGLDEVCAVFSSRGNGCGSFPCFLLERTSPAAAAPIPEYDVLYNQQRAGQGRRPRRPRRGGPPLPDTGVSSRRG